jgi:archaellin
MNNNAITGISATILLGCIILIAGVAGSVVMNNSEEEIGQYEQILDNTYNEIVNYIQVKDIVGKYSSINGEKQIDKIAILIKPLFTNNMDTTEFLIKLNNGEQIKILSSSEQTEFIYSNSLFNHPLWNNMRGTGFSIIAIHDKDRSIIDYNTINHNTDMAYIIIPFTEEFAMKKGDTMTVSIIPSTGVIKTIAIEAPLPMQSIVDLY